MTGLVYLFPGQGSQHVEMGQEVCYHSPEAQALFERADQILGISLSRLCFAGPADELTDTVNAQPAILVTSLVMLAAARAGCAPAANWVAGHSLGHFTALVAAGSLDFETALRLVRARGEAMKRAGTERDGGMAAIIRLDTAALSQICEQVRNETGSYVSIANDNAPGQVVIAGERRALEQAMQLSKAAGARRAIPLPVTVASHSPLMTGAAEALDQMLPGIEIRAPEIPIISNVTASPLEGAADIKRDIVQQLTQPVKWTASIQAIADSGGRTFVEIGPGSVLTGLAKRILPSPNAWSLEDGDGLSRLLAQPAGQ